MTLSQMPNGWTQPQLQALNDLTALSDAYNVAKTVKTLLNDTSPEAVQVMTDLANLARDDWLIIKTYST